MPLTSSSRHTENIKLTAHGVKLGCGHITENMEFAGKTLVSTPDARADTLHGGAEVIGGDEEAAQLVW
jgi:hypothetical protein